MLKNKEIIIVGAGIGGLTLARALEQKGINFELYEQADSFEALGYGLQISPNVVRVLRKLELGKQLENISHLCQGFELRCLNSDQILAKWQIDSDVPYYQCRRADLHQLLFNSIQDKTRIHFWQRLKSYEPKDNQLYLNFQNQASVTAKALIAADGIHSAVRKSLFPNYQAQYSGYAAFRMIVPWQKKYNSLLGKAIVWMGENHHVVVYPNGNQNADLSWLNLVLVVKDPNWTEEGWKIPVDKKEVAQDFANQSSLLNEILHDMVVSSEPCFKWGLFIHPPLPYWSKDKVTLLGDAAHPMLPFQAQGAAMAIEDAYVLAKCIASEGDIDQAFCQYERARMKRTKRVQQVSRKNANIFHATGIRATLRNFALGLVSTINPNLLNQKSAWIYDFDVT